MHENRTDRDTSMDRMLQLRDKSSRRVLIPKVTAFAYLIIFVNLILVTAPSSAAQNQSALNPEHLALAAELSAKADGVSMLVMQAGEIIYEDYPTRYHAQAGPDTAFFLASGTKSFWGPVAAAMIADGMVENFDEPVSKTITEWQGTPKESITLRQLLSLTSGIDADYGGQGVQRYALSLQAPLKNPPGSRFEYGPAPYQIFGEFIRRKLREEGIGGAHPDPVEDYLKPRILDRIGSEPAFWRYSRNQDDPNDPGDAHLPSGGRFTAREWAKFGDLLRQGGRWGDEQIIPAKLLAECVQGSKAHPRYGLTLWLDPSAPGAGDHLTVSARGLGKQQLFINHELELVILRQSSSTTSTKLAVAARKALYDRNDFLSLALRGRIAGADPDGDLIANARDAFPNRGDAWIDADTDGMDEHFEQRIARHNPDDDIKSFEDVKPGDDYDSDGKSNLEEFRDRTDPTRAEGESMLYLPHLKHH